LFHPAKLLGCENLQVSGYIIVVCQGARWAWPRIQRVGAIPDSHTRSFIEAYANASGQFGHAGDVLGGVDMLSAN
jgi:hypothetical protein